jgi:nitrile hydratase accessory protein
MSQCQTLSEENIQDIHVTSARSARDGEEAFRLPWELRSFALGVAYHESANFPWSDFQSNLIKAIDKAEDKNKPEHYYARWVEALESLLAERGGLDLEEVNRRTQTILNTPRDDTHKHLHGDDEHDLALPSNRNHHTAHTEPIAVDPARTDHF